MFGLVWLRLTHTTYTVPYCRALYSNPPVHGARIVADVVGDETMFEEWNVEMAAMAGRIKVVEAEETGYLLPCGD